MRPFSFRWRASKRRGRPCQTLAGCWRRGRCLSSPAAISAIGKSGRATGIERSGASTANQEAPPTTIAARAIQENLAGITLLLMPGSVIPPRDDLWTAFNAHRDPVFLVVLFYKPNVRMVPISGPRAKSFLQCGRCNAQNCHNGGLQPGCSAVIRARSVRILHRSAHSFH